MTFDLDRARRETPGSAHVLHFNNAGAGLMPQAVLDATVGHLRLEAEMGGYEAHDRELARIEGVYDSVARLVGCRREEVALVEHATRAWDLAFYAVALGPGDRILTSVAEYAANYVAFLHAARRTGATVEVVPNDEHGQLSVDALAATLDDRVRLVAVNHVPTSSGLVNPVAEIGRVAREAGALYLVDACQSIGQMPVDVDEIGCDMLSATGRKFLRGPRGTGFLYVRAAVLDRLDPPMLDHHGAEWVTRDRYELRPDARRFENWEASYACRLGMGAAIDYALEWGMEAIRERSWGLAGMLRERLASTPGVAVRDVGRELCAIVTFTVAGAGPGAVKAALAAERINVSVSDVTSARLDFEARDLEAVVRASPHYYNDEAELDRFSAAVARIAAWHEQTTGRGTRREPSAGSGV
jgi:cysteine desulfurase/selenocysteine lyase